MIEIRILPLIAPKSGLFKILTKFYIFFHFPLILPLPKIYQTKCIKNNINTQKLIKKLSKWYSINGYKIHSSNTPKLNILLVLEQKKEIKQVK